MLITDAKNSDIDAITALEKTCFTDDAWTKQMLIDALSDKNITVLVAKDDNKLLGYGVLRIVLDEAEIDNIAVDPQNARCGIGTKLLSKMLELAKEFGAKTAFLEVAVNNKSANALYVKQGFKVLSLRKNYYKNSDAYSYFKEL